MRTPRYIQYHPKLRKKRIRHCQIFSAAIEQSLRPASVPRGARCDRWWMAARKRANRPSTCASGAHAWARSGQILDAPIARTLLSISGTLFILRKKPSVAGPAKVRFGPILGHRELPRGSHATPPVPTDAPGSGDVHRHPDLHLAAPWSDLRVDPWWRPIQPPEASSRWAASELRRSILTATRGG